MESVLDYAPRNGCLLSRYGIVSMIRAGELAGGRTEKVGNQSTPPIRSLSFSVLYPLKGFLIDREILSLSNGDNFDQDLLVDDLVHDPNRFLRRIEFVVAGEVESCPIAKMLSEPWGGFEFSELLRNRFFQRSVKTPKVLGGCDSQDDAIPQDGVPSATTPV